MTEEQIKYMVDRFLGWKLPESFAPDGGVSFTKTFNDHMSFGPMKHEPYGTNLLNADQATAMVRHMIAELPQGDLTVARLQLTRIDECLVGSYGEIETMNPAALRKMLGNIAYIVRGAI